MNEPPLRAAINNIFNRLSEPDLKMRSNLVDAWPQISGAFFSKHTKPRFGAANEVLVWVDDSTMAFELSQRYKPVILKRLQNQFGEEHVKSVRFFVGEIR
jgi:predicted nucleic acid-binding Zn ribbon protein